MEESQKTAEALAADIAQAAERLELGKHERELAALKTASQQPDFWQDNRRAQDAMRRIAKLEDRLAPWQDIRSRLADITELLRLGDTSMAEELRAQLTDIAAAFSALKEQLKLSGPYDDHDAIVSIYAGAGGTDAQDWAQMLLRMYLRYAEKSGFKTTMIDESVGDEAGIKSATFEVDGSFVYGKLKGEHGVHRLVRLSPFNAESRETSFVKVEIIPKIDQPEDVAIDDKDLRIDVYRSGGHGGQSVNTTDSAVRVTHLPTGIVVAIQNERSQLQNKETALTILRSKLAQLQQEQHAEKIGELKGPSQSAEWGNQIRSYVLHPYKQVKDLRTEHVSSDPDKVLAGDLDDFINAYLDHSLGQ